MIRSSTPLLLAITALGISLSTFPGCSWSDVRTPKQTTSPADPGPTRTPTPTYLDTDVTAIDGSSQSLKAYQGDVVLIVNTASNCGLTGQYEGLQKLHKTYAKKGLRVLGFPSNDFGSQEPGSEEEIQSFCSKRYQVTFPLFAKVNADSSPLHPLYKKLTQDSPEGIRGPVKWNFTKFLVGRDGSIIARFEPAVAPLDEQVIAHIESALAKKVSP